MRGEGVRLVSANYNKPIVICEIFVFLTFLNRTHLSGSYWWRLLHLVFLLNEIVLKIYVRWRWIIKQHWTLNQTSFLKLNLILIQPHLLLWYDLCHLVIITSITLIILTNKVTEVNICRWICDPLHSLLILHLPLKSLHNRQIVKFLIWTIKLIKTLMLFKAKETSLLSYLSLLIPADLLIFGIHQINASLWYVLLVLMSTYLLTHNHLGILQRTLFLSTCVVYW